MIKNIGTRIATTFTFRPSFMRQTADTEELIKSAYVWPFADEAQATVDRLIHSGYEYTRYEAPGLTVYAFYAGGEMINCIVIEDTTAARLHKAVRREQPVTVTYTKADGTETVRTIEPRSLRITQAGNMIVKALDRASGEHRTFRLDRIRTYTVHRGRFTVPEPVRATWWIYVTDPDTQAAAYAPETVQDQLADAWASGRRYARIYA